VALAGKSLAVNESVAPTVVDITPDIKGLNELLEKAITVHTIKTRQPRSQAIGEYREDPGNVLEAWERETERTYRLYKTLSVKAMDTVTSTSRPDLGGGLGQETQDSPYRVK